MVTYRTVTTVTASRSSRKQNKNRRGNRDLFGQKQERALQLPAIELRLLKAYVRTS